MNDPIVYHSLIIPSVVIPFTALLAALSALATFIAGLFGLQLKAEGPKKLLEVMLKPRVLFAALITNLLVIGGIAGFKYWKNYPSFEFTIQKKQSAMAKESVLVYPNSVDRFGKIAPTSKGKVEEVWSKKLNSGSFRGAIHSGDSLFIGLDDGTIQEIHEGTGDLVRSFFVGTSVSAAPIVFENALYCGEGTHDTHHARLYKFDLKSGKFIGAYQTKGHIEGEPVAVVVDGIKTIFVPSGSDGLHAVDPDTLKQRWHVNDGHVDSAVQVVGNRVFSGTGMEKEKKSGNQMFAISYEANTGKKIWQKEIPASSWMQPIAVAENICFVVGEVYFKSELGGIYCFAQKDGTPTVTYNNGAPIVAVPSYIEKDILISDLSGKVCRVDMEIGRAKWCTETGKASFAFANPSVDFQNGLVLYPAQKSGLFVLDPATGKIIENWNLKEKPWATTYAPVAVTDESWITMDMKGMLRKLTWKKSAH